MLKRAKLHQADGEIFDVKCIRQNQIRGRPACVGTLTARPELLVGRAHHRFRLRVTHEIERQIEQVNADIDEGSAALLFLIDENAPTVGAFFHASGPRYN